MNPLLHFLISYLLVELVFTQAKKYLLLIFISSTFLDLDHIFYILKKREKILEERFGSKSRSILHELLGMLIFSFIISILYFFVDITLIKIFSLCLFLHYSFDFLIGKSRPFFPYSKKEIKIILLSKDSRIFLEIILTILLSLFFISLL